MSSYNNDSSTATEAPAVQEEAIATAVSEPASSMSMEEMNNAREQIAQYTDPAIQGMISSLVAANGNNPERLVQIVRNLVDEIEKAKQNPHSNYPVSPEIADIIEKIREVEREKPDPLNAFRGGSDQSKESGTNDLSLIGDLVGGVAKASGRGASAETEVGQFAFADIPEMPINGFTSGPGQIPDVRVPGLGIGNSLGGART